MQVAQTHMTHMAHDMLEIIQLITVCYPDLPFHSCMDTQMHVALTHGSYLSQPLDNHLSLFHTYMYFICVWLHQWQSPNNFSDAGTRALFTV